MGCIFSTDQQSVIDSRKQNVLVSAAAGSGKTSVLTERIVRLIDDPVHPVDIDHILVVTFTHAAADEMKERIGNSLNELIAANPGNSHLEKQATLIHSAQITTIDSFCLYLVRNHFHKIDVDPSFRIAGEGEIKLLKEEVLKDVIDRAYESGDESFYHMVDCYSKKDKDDTLESSILTLFTYSMSYPWPRKWLEKRREDYHYESLSDFENSTLLADVKAVVVRTAESALTEANKAVNICLLPDGPVTYLDAVNGDMELLKELSQRVSKKSFNEIRDYLCNISFPALSRKKCECSEDLKDEVKNLRDKYKKLITDLKTGFFGASLEEAFENINTTAPVINKLIDLVEDFEETFSREKRDRGIIDFNDMEHMAIQILIEDYKDEGTYTVTDVARDYQKYFEEVMVDEYQDSNLVQELIVQSVSRELSNGTNNRFMVGDVKQSIYRFRLARPEIFMKKSAIYSKEEKSPDRLITLKKNFRSRKAVIDSVNAVFLDIMKCEIGGIDYDDDAKLYPGALYDEDSEDNRTEVVLVKKDGKSKDARETEADIISLKIKDIKKNGHVYNLKSKETEKASYRDIAVLLRSGTKWLDAIKASFEKNQIPYILEGVGAFYDTTEISDVLSFLRVLNNPLDDISVYAAMTSPFGRFTDEECAYIKGTMRDSGRFLWDKVRAFSDAKAENFVTMIMRYRKLSEVLPIHELILRLFDETGYKAIVAAKPNGKQRLANVNMLVIKASEYAKTSFYGLFHFLRYVELMKKIDEDEGEANTFDENSDVVRVMTIHKSKGLEFPYCIIAGIDEKFNEADQRNAFVTDIDEGIGAYCIDPVKRLKTKNLKRSIIIDRIKRESLGEEIRVLYVAMTRAKEKLIMLGLCEEPEKWLESASEKSQGSYMSLMHETIVKNNGTVFKTEIMSGDDILATDITNDLDLEESRRLLEEGVNNCDPMLLDKLKERLEFKYPHAGLEKLYTKTTVSELKMAAIELQSEENEAFHPFAENEAKEYVPVFKGGNLSVKGTDRGTAYHNLLQLLDFKRFTPETVNDDKLLLNEYNRQLSRMREKGEMEAADQEKVFESKILAFLRSDIAEKMAAADSKDSLYKEQPFVIGVPASTVNSDFPKEETVLVQGVIDVYFIEDGKVTVLDYKTDRVDSKEELIKRYKKQLDYYGDAVKQLTGLEVFKKVIYSFGLEECFVVE